MNYVGQRGVKSPGDHREVISRHRVHGPMQTVDVPESLVEAIVSKAPVTRAPHSLYKYPARFAPDFAREAIRVFSKPGDFVLDVFNGGGTTTIEAVALGRHAWGFDVSQLACFIAKVKTTPLSIHDERSLLRWCDDLNVPTCSTTDAWNAIDTEDGYYRKNLPEHSLRFFAGIMAEIATLKRERQRRFVRLVLLAVGQWALDCKKVLPSHEQMVHEFIKLLRKDLSEYRAYLKAVGKSLGLPPSKVGTRRRIIRASSELCGKRGKTPKKKFSLVVTSPPYPGVHMLYHRWQIDGRRETPAPFAIANCRDGDGESFYCLGRRYESGLKTYYSRLTKIFTAAKSTLANNALVVQMVAFNDPEWQLPAFLEAMDAAGYDQLHPATNEKLAADGRLWRRVPGRKWYAALSPAGAAGKEVVLFHRPRQQ